MLLQRLKPDDTCGLNYDYMGAAEYEFGATANGRLAIARLFLNKEMAARTIRFVEVHGMSERAPVDVLAVGTQDMLANIAGTAKIRVIKEAFRTDDPRIIGWMNVGHDENVTPFLMVRLSIGVDNVQKRIQAFLERPIEHLREEGREA